MVPNWERAMVRIFRTAAILGSLVACALAVPAGTAAAAAVIRSQTPCAGLNGICIYFARNIPVQLDLRSFKFTAPSKGSAEVSFHGSMVCDGDSTPGNKVVDLATQIVNSTTAIATPQEPGGLRQALVISPITSDTLNLASTRVFTFNAAGSQTYYYRMRPLRIDAGVACSVYNAAFTVVFIP